MADKKLSRRDLLKGTASTVFAFTIVPRHVLGGQGHTAPSERLTKAIIGTGGMGRGHIGMGDTQLLALCDVDSAHLKMAMDQAAENGHKGVKGYRDFREVLERKDIDIIHIPTPPHWHALISIMAARAGKDIWCEKPMARTINEGKAVVDAVNEYGRIFRINTGSRFEGDYYGMDTPVKKLKKLVESGLLGWPLKVRIGKSTGFDWKLDQWCGRPGLKPEAVPAELDYDMWLGPAPYKPYHPHRVHLSFRGYWDYDGGGLGDMGQHYIDPAQYILNKDNTSPIEIEADSPQQHPDAVGEWRTIRYKYADGCEIILDALEKRDDVPYLEGPGGKLFPKFRSSIPDLEKKLASFPDPEPQLTDFIDCVRTRRKFALNETNAHRSCTVVNLGKIAQRTGKVLHFNPETQTFINDEQANRLLGEPMRGPWHI